MAERHLKDRDQWPLGPFRTWVQAGQRPLNQAAPVSSWQGFGRALAQGLSRVRMGIPTGRRTPSHHGLPVSSWQAPIWGSLALSLGVLALVTLAFPYRVPAWPTALDYAKDQDHLEQEAFPEIVVEQRTFVEEPQVASLEVPQVSEIRRDILKEYRAYPQVPSPDERGLVTLYTKSGLKYVVLEKVALRFQKLLGWLEDRGYKIKEIGCYDRRTVAGQGNWSNHARGTACDVNPDQNPVRYGFVKTDLPGGVGDFAKTLRLEWGARWFFKKDAMHFEAMESKKYAVIGGGGRQKSAGKRRHRHVRYVQQSYLYDHPEIGIASAFNDPVTACPPFRLDPKKIEVAHKTLECGSKVLVENLENGKSVVATVADVGPCTTPDCQSTAPDRIKDRILDMSPSTEKAIGSDGLTKVRVTVLHDGI